MEWLGEFFGSFFNDIYNLAVQFAAWFEVRMANQLVEFKQFLLTLSWDVAKEILVNVHFSELLSSSFNSLNPSMKGILLYIQLDKGITVMTQAFLTRFMLNMMGW